MTDVHIQQVQAELDPQRPAVSGARPAAAAVSPRPDEPGALRGTQSALELLERRRARLRAT